MRGGESGEKEDVPGFAIKSSSSTAFSPACNPSTSRRYSSSSFEASFSLILCSMAHRQSVLRQRARSVAPRHALRTHSSIFCVRVSTLRAAVSSIGRVRSIESDSMQTLSVQVR